MAKFDLENEEFGMDKKKVVSSEKNEDMGTDTTVSTVTVASQTVLKKAPMMNIRFTPENYDYMRREAAIRGLSVTAFTNWIINAYKADSNNVHENPIYRNEENW